MSSNGPQLSQRPSHGPSHGPSQRPQPQLAKPPVLISLANPRKRIRFVTVIFLVVMLGYVTKLVEIQIIRGPELAATAQNSRIQTLLLPATRGGFTDRNGTPIAITIMARNVTVDPTLITDPVGTAAALSSILGIPQAQIVESLTIDSRFSYVAKRITPETWQQVAELGIPGVFSEPTTNRTYPNGKLAASIVGYVGAEGTGLGGLEFGLNKQLMGQDGTDRKSVV